MTNRHIKNKNILRILAWFVGIGTTTVLGLSAYSLNANYANKPESTTHLCQGGGTAYTPQGVIIEEADLGCMVNDQNNIRIWEAANTKYLLRILIGSSVLAISVGVWFKYRKKRI